MVNSPFGLSSPFYDDPFHAGGVVSFPDYSAGGVEPSLVLDFCAKRHGSRPLDETDYVSEDVTPGLVLDFGNKYAGSRPLDGDDYKSEGETASLVLDFNNKFHGVS